MLNKVPEVTIYFWVIKIMATTVGETAADFLSVKLKLGLSVTSYVMGALLLIALLAQVRSKKYVPWIYWITVVLISVVGTLITDNLVDNFGVPLTVTTAVFSVALLVTFAAWYTSEKTLSVHTICTTRRELFYWAAILFTFALGTAAGDLTAERLGVGYANSATIFGAAIALVTLARYYLRMDAILAFWTAYVLTRPLGASLGDLFSQPTGNGGLGLGTVVTSAIFLVTILGLVAYMTLGERNGTAARKSA
ncbi:MAG: hypothetical protein KGJ99_11860 [Betaproteobacteria bacterium]|nr:hypothetical protein [Betaproteobacteria bacterium]MDE2210411.1 hypothetical protein [Betaproteobacteria bacterium]